MIRLNFHCSLIPIARQTKPGSNHGSFIIQNPRASKFSRRVSIKLKAIKGEMNGETSGSSGGSWDPGLEIEVPFEQRPVCVNNYAIVAIISFIIFAILSFICQHTYKLKRFSKVMRMDY